MVRHHDITSEQKLLPPARCSERLNHQRKFIFHQRRNIAPQVNRDKKRLVCYKQSSYSRHNGMVATTRRHFKHGPRHESGAVATPSSDGIVCEEQLRPPLTGANGELVLEFFS